MKCKSQNVIRIFPSSPFSISPANSLENIPKFDLNELGLVEKWDSTCNTGKEKWMW